MTKYLPKTKVRKQKNLLGGSVDEQAEQGVEEEPEQDIIVSHWHKVRESKTQTELTVIMPIVVEPYFGSGL